MADTIRTKNALLALFADNNVGAISEQDLRDFVVSIYAEPASKTLDGISNAEGDIDLVAGSNVTITPDDANNTITISSTSSGVSGTGADNNITRWDGTSDIQNSNLAIGDNGELYGGQTANGGTITTTGAGAWAGGYANGASSVITAGIGAFARGYAYDGGTITATGYSGFSDQSAAMAVGWAKGSSSTLEASHWGSLAMGAATNGGTITATYASFGGGYANGATIQGGQNDENYGSFAFGVADAGSTILARGNASTAFGRATDGGNIYSRGDGSLVVGYCQGNGDTAVSELVADNGAILGVAECNKNGSTAQLFADDRGSFITGRAEVGSNATGGHNSRIRALQDGARAGGFAEQDFGSSATDSLIEASQSASWAFGRASSGGQITASSVASKAFGFATSNGTIASSGFGSIAMGYSSTGDATTSSGAASMAVGRNAQATANHAICLGRDAIADRQGQIAHNSGTSFAADGDAQRTVTTLMVSTTDGNATEMTIDGAAAAASNRFTLDDESTLDCFIMISARRDTGVEHASFIRRVLIERTAGTTALVGSVSTIGSDIGSNGGSPPAGWGVSISADDTNDNLVIDVTGASSTNIRWYATIYANEIEYSD